MIAYADIMWLARGHVEVLLFKISNKAQLALSEMMEIGFLGLWSAISVTFCS